MLLFLQLYRNTLARSGAVLLEFCSMLLPRFSHFVLLMKPHAPEPLTAMRARGFIAEDAENSALTTGHCGECT